tara:strand:+ start:6269 stop:6580 length:312 start_codon:yes stop_codon:yes gene_type:complete
MFSGKPFFQIPRPIRRKGFLNVETIIGHKTLTARDSYIQVLDGGGSTRHVIMPLELDGISYQIKNNGATNNLLVKNAAGSTQATIAIGTSAILVCDGTVWVAL